MIRLILSILFLWVVECSAGIYKWTDDKGIVHFSDQIETTKETQEIGMPASYRSNSKLQNYKYKVSTQSDSRIIRYIDEALVKADEMNREAESCYYYAVNKNELDVSCKNYFTLLNRDLKPLIKKIKSYLNSNPKIQLPHNRYSKLTDISKNADNQLNRAVNYIMNVLLNTAKKIEIAASSCYSSAIIYGYLNNDCQNYQSLLNQEYVPLEKNLENFILVQIDDDGAKMSLKQNLNTINQLIIQAKDDYHKSVNYIAQKQRK